MTSIFLVAFVLVAGDEKGYSQIGQPLLKAKPQVISVHQPHKIHHFQSDVINGPSLKELILAANEEDCDICQGRTQN